MPVVLQRDNVVYISYANRDFLSVIVTNNAQTEARGWI